MSRGVRVWASERRRVCILLRQGVNKAQLRRGAVLNCEQGMRISARNHGCVNLIFSQTAAEC